MDEPDAGERLYAKDDDDYFDEELISILAAASQYAYDCFKEPADFEYPRGAPAFQLLKKGEVEDIGYAFLRIQYGRKYANKVIFAIRGTVLFTKKPKVAGPGVSIMYSDERGEILTALNAMEAKFCDIVSKKPLYRPDFVTGHSWGGTMAEVMCARHQLPGASFGAPGPYSDYDKYNLIADLTKHEGVPFRSVVNPKDRFPTISRDQMGTMLAIDRKAAKHAKKEKQKFDKIDVIEFFAGDDDTVHAKLEKHASTLAGFKPTTAADLMHIVRKPHYVGQFGDTVQESHSCVGYCKAVGQVSGDSSMYKMVKSSKAAKHGEDDVYQGELTEEDRVYAVDDPEFFDDELVSILATACQYAYDCFKEPADYSYPRGAAAFELLERGNADEIGYAFFRIQYGVKYAGKVIFAIRGTVPIATNNLTEPDLAMFIGKRGVVLRSINKVETEFSRLIEESPRLKPDFVTGHSLGGTTAEVMCARHGIPGVSFAAPGPYSTNIKYNLIAGLKNHKGVPFKSVVNPADYVPTISRDKVGTKFVVGQEATTDASLMHIVPRPHIVEAFGSSLLTKHTCIGYIKAVGQLSKASNMYKITAH